MLLEYVAGGELFTYLRTSHRFDNPSALFFASEIVMALDYMHSQDIVYRWAGLMEYSGQSLGKWTKIDTCMIMRFGL